ncbi:PREDICTED: angiogenic factor with G patch and FHA domains 1-like [Acropora digitifera]|uniref:angiogenic factor with G patch and FHA domains 1-like n=1 Tax=Acropora digitifera TaxID=70779 RepID=UPI00077AAFDB|nr:PREDICTED: angiogenic factor with G patch and FHA domains 1-like [Acropora digitifera]
MDESEDKEGNWNNSCNGDPTENNTDDCLKRQVDDLKRDVESLKKKLHKAEFERDNALKNVANLKDQVKDLSRKLQGEKKKNVDNKRGSDDLKYSNASKDERPEASKNKDLRASLEEAATDAMGQSGFVYDHRTGLYYDWNSGYYYDPNSRLYYENTTGTYYYYDEESASYKFHSQVDLSGTQKKSPDKENTDDLESGEEISDDEEASVKDIEALLDGSTYTGGTIGREKKVSHVLRIPDVEVSKVQCKVEFDRERRQYFISDVGSRNGTFLNGIRLSESKQKSEPQVLTHGDELILGSTTLHLHIHPGSQTCDSCEPGQIQAQVLNQAPAGGTSFDQDDEVCITKVIQGSSPITVTSTHEQRKLVLKRIKKAYALEESGYCEEIVDGTLAGKYKDRADVRRTKVGSDVPVVIADDAPASVHRPISAENVGRQMLEKMGWSEGEGLGREGAGRREPVIVEVRDSLRGLGTGVKRSLDDAEGKSYIRAKTRERFGLAVNVISGPQRFVPANIEAVAKLSPSAVAESKKPTEKEMSPKDGTEKCSKDEGMDIFAE